MTVTEGSFCNVPRAPITADVLTKRNLLIMLIAGSVEPVMAYYNPRIPIPNRLSQLAFTLQML